MRQLHYLSISKSLYCILYDNRPRKEDFAEGYLIQKWTQKVAEARAIFKQNYDRNATKSTTGKIIVGLCSRLSQHAGFS